MLGMYIEPLGRCGVATLQRPLLYLFLVISQLLANLLVRISCFPHFHYLWWYFYPIKAIDGTIDEYDKET